MTWGVDLPGKVAGKVIKTNYQERLSRKAIKANSKKRTIKKLIAITTTIFGSNKCLNVLNGCLQLPWSFQA